MAAKAHKGQWRVTVQEQACSLCGACAQWCGPAALALQQLDGQVVLRFAAERCPGCGLCVQACPEKAVQLTQVAAPAVVGPAAVSTAVPRVVPPVVLASSPLSNCARCGKPSVPSRMLDSMSHWSHAPGHVGDGPDAGAADQKDYATCLACRSDMMFFGNPLHA